MHNSMRYGLFKDMNYKKNDKMGKLTELLPVESSSLYHIWLNLNSIE